MKQLWAPWRVEYILGEKSDGCFLCDIIEGDKDRENLLLKRGKACAVVMNRYPYNGGHLMVLPYRHVSEIGDLTSEEKVEVMELVDESINVLKKTIYPAAFNVGANLGKVAGAGLESHLHMHIVPRWEGDTNFMPVLSDVRVVPVALLDLWDMLKPEFC
jgi:ATP adenylyltransferase